MKDFNHIPNKEFVFAMLLLVANKMDTLLERCLSPFNVTSKQWFLLLCLFNLFESPPTIKALAKEMGSSHQNVKQVALKLEEKGLLKLEKDKKDLRSTRLVPTAKSYEFWQASSEVGAKFMQEFYFQLEDKTLDYARMFISQIILNMQGMEDNDVNTDRI
jgi:MarR family transcriptional regulator, transcriptional regulator for hemolysin